jgi:hypothetical protein
MYFLDEAENAFEEEARIMDIKLLDLVTKSLLEAATYVFHETL